MFVVIDDIFCLSVLTLHHYIEICFGLYRYVVTAVTSVHEMENGFNVWSFNGKLLYRILKDHFFQVSPPIILMNQFLVCLGFFLCEYNTKMRMSWPEL